MTYELPLVDQDLVLNKQEFRDSLCLPYNLPLVGLQSQCVCGNKFTVGYALSCKRGGFVAQQGHDGIRNLSISFINKVCTDVSLTKRYQVLENRTPAKEINEEVERDSKIMEKAYTETTQEVLGRPRKKKPWISIESWNMIV